MVRTRACTSRKRVPNNPEIARLLECQVGAHRHSGARGEHAPVRRFGVHGSLFETSRVPEIPVVSRIRPPRSCGGDHRAGAVNEPGGVCALVDSLTDPPPRLDRSDVCGVDPGASARARPPHALEPEGDTPRATSPLAQRPPGRSPSWSSTRRFRENVADKISLFFPLIQPAV